MFHNDLVPVDKRQEYRDAFGRMGDAVEACLRTYLWGVEAVQTAAYADGNNLHAVPLMMMLDLAEAIDGVVILVRSGSAKNCSGLLRTALEIQLSLKYILEHKDTYEQRVLSYEYYHLRDRLRWAQRCDPNSEVGKQLRAELAGDQFADIFDVPGVDVAAEAKDAQTKMDSSRYATVRAELARMKAAKIRDGNWFSLWDGPKDVRALALHLKVGSLYESLYRGYSTAAHGAAAVKRITGKHGDGMRLEPLRSPNGLPAMCRNACQICNTMTVLLVDGLVPHLRPEVKERYIRDIKPGLLFIDSVKGLGG